MKTRIFGKNYLSASRHLLPTGSTTYRPKRLIRFETIKGFILVIPVVVMGNAIPPAHAS